MWIRYAAEPPFSLVDVDMARVDPMSTGHALALSFRSQGKHQLAQLMFGTNVRALLFSSAQPANRPPCTMSSAASLSLPAQTPAPTPSCHAQCPKFQVRSRIIRNPRTLVSLRGRSRTDGPYPGMDSGGDARFRAAHTTVTMTVSRSSLGLYLNVNKRRLTRAPQNEQGRVMCD